MKENKSYIKKKRGAYKIAYLYPIILIVAILPFIMRYHVYDTGLSNFTWYPPNTEHFDIFLYYKQIIYIITSSVMLFCICFELYKKKGKFKVTPLLIFLFMYGLLSLLSTIFSDYRSFGFTGVFDQFESIFVLLGYCITIFYTYIFITDLKHIEIIFKYLTISILIMSLIGFTQIIGHNFLATDIGMMTFLPDYVWSQRELFTFNFEKTVSLTLFNPNYVGTYAGLLLPIYVSLALTYKKNRHYLLIILSILGLAICLKGSESESGIIGILTSVIFIIIFYRKYIFRHIVAIASFLLVLILGFYLLIFAQPTNLLTRLIPQKQTFALTDIKTEDILKITYKENLLLVDYIFDNEDLQLFLYDEFYNPISFNYIDESMTFQIIDKRFHNMKIEPFLNDNKLYLNIYIDNNIWTFTKHSDNTYYYVNRYGKMDKIIEAPSSLFSGYEHFASKRGYIWSRTIPLLKDYIFLGSGADTFVLAFPQQDYVNLHNNGFSGKVLTKPHNMYLQTGVQTGVLSLLAFILFYIIYFISSVRYYIKADLSNPLHMYGCAIFIGTISYMVIGLANDSSITVSPVFWALIGLGIAINNKIKSDLLVN